MTRQEFIRQVQDYQKPLRRFLVALCCGDSQMADDVAQEALIKAYMAIDSLNDASKFKAWIFKIAYTTFISHKRSLRPFADFEEASTAPSENHADDAFRYQALYAALNNLPPKERNSVLLYYMEGYSIKEIAEISNLSTDAVKAHLCRGRAHLRNLLSNA